MTWLLHRFWQLLLFRKGPQDLPASTALLAGLLLADALLDVAKLSLINACNPKNQINFYVIPLATVFFIAVYWGVLNFHQKTNRLVQSLSALIVVGMAYGIGMMLITYVGGCGGAPAKQPGFYDLAILFAWLAIHVWWFMQVSEIFRATLELKNFVASIYTLAFIVLQIMFVNWVGKL